jgi:predicted transcriptional regulator with HTH domain
MLQFIKGEVDNLTGITPQRRGAIDNRETVGGVERSVMQSSNITEEWFSVHDNTKVRALRALLEAAKIAYKGKSFVKEFVLDDGTKQMLEFDYNTYREACYGVDVSNASDDAQVLQALKGLSERYLQAGGNFGLVAELMNAKDRATITRKIQEDEQQKQQQAQEQFKAEQEAVQAQIQKEVEIKDAELVLEYDKLDREDMNKQLDREATIQRETIKALGFAQDTDVNDNNVPDVLEQSKLALQQVKQSQEILLKEKELEVKKRKDEKDIEIKEKELAIKKEELAVKERDSQRKLKIAKTNKNKYDK